MLDVVDSGRFILGPQTRAFEEEFARYVGTAHAVAVSQGTSAIQLAILSFGVRPGDEVLVPSMTAFPTIEGVIHAGATPVFVDSDAFRLHGPRGRPPPDLRPDRRYRARTPLRRRGGSGGPGRARPGAGILDRRRLLPGPRGSPPLAEGRLDRPGRHVLLLSLQEPDRVRGRRHGDDRRSRDRGAGPPPARPRPDRQVHARRRRLQPALQRRAGRRRPAAACAPRGLHREAARGRGALRRGPFRDRRDYPPRRAAGDAPELPPLPAPPERRVRPRCPRRTSQDGRNRDGHPLSDRQPPPAGHGVPRRSAVPSHERRLCADRALAADVSRPAFRDADVETFIGGGSTVTWFASSPPPASMPLAGGASPPSSGCAAAASANPPAVPGLEVQQQPELVVAALRSRLDEDAHAARVEDAVGGEVAPLRALRKGSRAVWPSDPRLEGRREPRLGAGRGSDPGSHGRIASRNAIFVAPGRTSRSGRREKAYSTSCRSRSGTRASRPTAIVERSTCIRPLSGR